MRCDQHGILLKYVNQMMSTGKELLNALKEHEIYVLQMLPNVFVFILKLYELPYPILSIERIFHNALK